MTTIILLRGRAARVGQARTQGFLLTDSAGTIGASDWMKECWRTGQPYILLAISPKRARLYCELDDHPLGDEGQAAIVALLAEHSSSPKWRRSVSSISIFCSSLTHSGGLLTTQRLIELLRSESRVTR